MRELNNKIDVFRNKLEYLNRNIELVDFSEISSINRFLDIFMDNIFSDLVANETISENKSSLKKLKNKIENIKLKLMELDNKMV